MSPSKTDGRKFERQAPGSTLADPKNMAIFGSSAGGNLTLAMILRAKQENLLPAAIAPGTPMSDLTNAGDSFRTNAMLDNVLVAPGASCANRVSKRCCRSTKASRTRSTTAM